MPITLTGDTISISYTGRDYESFRDDFEELSSLVFPEWDLNEFDPAVVLAEYQARIGSNLNFYIDRRAEENYMKTCRLFTSALRIGEPYGIQPSYSSTASVSIIVTTDDAVVIPKYFRVSTQLDSTTPVAEYELLADYTCPSFGSYSVTFHHGKTYENQILGTSTGKPGQKFKILKKPIAYRSNGIPYIIIEVKNGATWEEWTRVNNFYSSDTDDKHFKAKLNEKGEYEIVFGDNVNGAIPPEGTQNIRATYRIGGGAEGSAPGPQTITRIADNKGATAVISVTNLTRPSGGGNGQTLEEFKTYFPSILAANDRVVTFDDAVAKLQDAGIGVHRSRAFRGKNPFEYTVCVAAEGVSPIPTGYWDSTLEVGEGLIGSVGEYLIDKLAGSIILTVLPVVAVPIVAELNVTCQRRTYQSLVRKNLATAISAFLNPSNYDIGQSLNMVEFGKMLDDVEGVDKVEILEFRRSPSIRFVKGNDSALFTSYIVGTGIKSEDWRIVFTDSTTFKVIGSVSGEQETSGIVTGGARYTTDNNEFSFIPSYIVGNYPGQGTEYRCKTSAFEADTILLDDDEIITEGTVVVNLTGGLV